MMRGLFPNLPFTLLPAFAVMFLVGWNLGLIPPAVVPEASDEPPARPRVGGPTPVSRMDAVRSARASRERSRQAIKLAQSLTAEELRDWLDEHRFDFRDGFEVMLFRKIAEERFARLDPESHADWDHRRGGRSRILEWAVRDPERFLDFAWSQPGHHRLLFVMENLAVQHPERAIGYLHEPPFSRFWGHTWTLRELHRRSPAALEQALETLPSQWRWKVEDIKLADAITGSFGPAVEALYQRDDGWEAFRRAVACIEDPGKLLRAELASLPDSWRAAVAAEPHHFLHGWDPAGWAGADFEGAGFTPEEAGAIRQAMGM